MNSALSQAVCLQCRSSLENFVWPADRVTCSTCQQIYPLVSNNIPILVENPNEYLAQMYVHYENYLKQQDDEIQKIARALSSNPSRMPILSAFQAAIRQNSQSVRSLQLEIRPHLSIEALAAVAVEEAQPVEGASYLSMLPYLQRDWGRSEESESELAAVEGPLFAKLKELQTERDSVLVLGAGAGRVAWDLRQLYDQVFATDMSLIAAYHFYQLLNEDVEFFELSANNLRRSTDGVRRHIASLKPPSHDGGAPSSCDNFSYFIGNARNIPLPDNSISAIISIYFTDLIPLRNLLPEVKRTLKKGGLFVHLGPLEYHFVDLNDSLAADEIKTFFAANNFSAIYETEISATYLRSSASMSARLFDNWFFVARKDVAPMAPPPSVVTLDSVLKLTGSLRFETLGVLSPDGEDVLETKLVLPLGEKYEGASTVMDILRIIDGQKSTREVIEILGQDYEISDDDTREILRTLSTLVDKGGLQIIY
jgi:carnosine N-methyltransferase